MSSYSALILAHGSLRWYGRLGEGSGTTLVDAGPNSLNGTYAASGITYGVAGAIANDANTAVTFAGTSDPAFCADNAALRLGNGPLTYEFWVKRSATQGAAQMLLTKAVGGPEIRWASNNKIQVFKSGTGVTAMTGGLAAATTDTTTWHHVVVAKNGATRLVYLDGVDVTVLTTDQTFVDGTTIPIGSDGSGGQRFPGSMDEIAIYGAVLTPEEVLQHYRTGRAQIQLTDSVTPSESRGASPGGVHTDSVTATDSRTSAAGKAQADSVTASDSTALVPGKVLVDSVSPSDARTSSVGQAQADTVTVSDALSAADILALGDSVTATDQISPDLLEQFTQTFGDSVSVLDSVAAVLSQTSGTATPQPGGGWVPVIRRVTVGAHNVLLTDSVLTRDEHSERLQMSNAKRTEELILALI